MQAYEFYAKPENGAILIPEKYKNLITDDITVIILDKKSKKINWEETGVQKKSDLLSPPILDTRGWKFDREEANER